MPRVSVLVVVLWLAAGASAPAAEDGDRAPAAGRTGQAAGQAATPVPDASPLPPQELPGAEPGRVPAGFDIPAETEVTIDRGTRVAAGIGLSGPLGVAASVQLLHGLAADVHESDGRVNAVCAVPIAHCAQGFLVEAQAGSGGGKLSLGVGARARVDEDDFHGTVGASLRASLARTWGNPFGTEPGLTYLGPELDLSVKRVDVTLGVLWRVSGHDGAAALFSWGLGFGL
jgi:hypothetical protein